MAFLVNTQTGKPAVPRRKADPLPVEKKNARKAEVEPLPPAREKKEKKRERESPPPRKKDKKDKRHRRA